MIKLRNSDNEIKLEVEGYSYPFAKDDWDANWLSVKLNFKNNTNGLIFENNDSCILTMELLDLKLWLEKIQNNKNEIYELKFTEPNLSFYYEKNELKVLFKYDFNPTGNIEDTYEVSFFLNDKILSSIITTVTTSITKFPKKFDPK